MKYFIFLCLVLSVTAFAQQKGEPLREVLGSWQIDFPAANDLKIDSTTKIDAATVKSEEVWASSPSHDRSIRIVRNSGLSLRGVGNFISDRVTEIKNRFGRHYDDPIAKNRVRCRPEIEKLREPSYRTLILMGADKSLEFGECDPKLIKHREIVALISCWRRGKIFEIDYFFPLSADANAIRDALAKMPCSKR